MSLYKFEKKVTRIPAVAYNHKYFQLARKAAASLGIPEDDPAPICFGEAFDQLSGYVQRARIQLKKPSVEETYTIVRNADGKTYSKKLEKRDVPSIKKAVEQIKADIKFDRSRKKIMRKMNKQTYAGNRTLNYDLVAGCFTEFGQILKLQRLKNAREVYNEKRPKTKDNYVGLELEFFCETSQDDLNDAFTTAELGKYVQLTSDGSVRPDFGDDYELRVLAKEEELEDVVKKVCKILEDEGAGVNKTCGFHVHLDMRNRNVDVCFSNLVSAQKWLYAMNPVTRSKNKFCRKTRTKNFTKQNYSETRYLGINPKSYDRHETLEVRIHSGTIESDKIINWVKVLKAVVEKKEIVKRSPSSLANFCQLFIINDELRNYIQARMDKFAAPVVTESVA